jgi:O-methyltransferase
LLCGVNRAKQILGSKREALIKRPVQEVIYRLQDPGLVADTLIRGCTSVWDRISPSEFSRLYRRVRSHTMCSNARLRALHRGVRYVLERGIPGDLVECGCARGGSAALMGLTLQEAGKRRKLWLFDTFEGLPAPTHDDPDYPIADLWTGGCVGTLEEVGELFDSLEISEDVELRKGLFQETLRKSGLQQIALLHIDGDWYQSVKVCLEELYDKVAPGGLIQFDDYGFWKGARKAVDEFFLMRGIAPNLQRIDYAGRLFKKTASSGKCDAAPAGPPSRV